MGVVRFDLRGNEAEISIYLVPGPHPPGEGRSLLHCAEKWLAANQPAIARIRARVLAGNERSARLFLGAGYVIEFADYSKAIRPSMSADFAIGGRLIGQRHPPFVIAEMSGNHNRSLERALEIVEAAARSGAAALKIQTYTPDTMTLDLDVGEFHIGDPQSPWKGTSLYRLYAEAQTPWEWHAAIFERARALGVIAFSSPFDASAVDFLETLEVPAYKIASFENTDIPLIRKVASTGKPMIISTGMASIEELGETVVRPVRPAARTWSCSNAPAPIRRRRSTPISAPFRICARCSIAKSAFPIILWASVCRWPASRSARPSSRSISP